MVKMKKLTIPITKIKEEFQNLLQKSANARKSKRQKKI
jgi:hypothetical protein